MGFEAGPMSNLYRIQSQIDDDDSIWSKLFDLCLIDVYETDSHQIITINSNDDNNNCLFKQIATNIYYPSFCHILAPFRNLILTSLNRMCH